MRLSRFRPRFTVRRLMIATAIVGLLLGAGLWVVKMRTLAADYRKRAYEFVMKIDPVVYRQIDFDVMTKDGGLTISILKDENYWLRAEWALNQADKYWQITQRPWLPVDPDLPCPQSAHPRSAVDCPAELVERARRAPDCRWFSRPVYPWWTFLWTWDPQTYSNHDPRWSFP